VSEIAVAAVINWHTICFEILYFSNGGNLPQTNHHPP
jgi:hypothetical protein